LFIFIENKKSKYCVKYWQEITKPFAERKEANKHKNTIYKGFTLRLRFVVNLN